MSSLARKDASQSVDLRCHHLVGRSSTCQLRLDHPEVSGVHALIEWTAAGWELRDLNSRNGTWLDGRRLGAEERAPLSAGAVLAFGAPGICWRLVSDRAPPARAFPSDGAAPREEQDGALALPDLSRPEVLVSRDEDGVWWVESAEGASLAAAQSTVRAGGLRWELDLPELDPRTPLLLQAPAVRDPTGLRFTVSSDEEHVALTAISVGGEVSLGARAHHYLLLTLARQRLADQREEPGAIGRHGWMQIEDLMRLFRMEETKINVQIFRIRRQFAELNLMKPQDIIERRRGTGQVRIGIEKIQIDRM